MSASRLGILRTLVEQGPSTVPQIARQRPVSRQTIQLQVDSLLSEGLVRVRETPQHRRSVLIELTPRARRVYAEIQKLQERVVERLAADAPPVSEIRRAIGVLVWLREALLRPERDDEA